MNIYRVPITYSFYGYFDIEAESAADARRHVLTECGLVLGGPIHSTLADDAVDWTFETHPTQQLGRVTIVQKGAGHAEDRSG